MNAANLNAVFYSDAYHPIQAGSIDGTDIVPHDNGVLRAVLCSAAGLYDPLGDPKVIGDPYCTIFVGRLSRQTSEETLRKAMSAYGKVKNMRLVRDIVTGASRGYAFVEYETERQMYRAYMVHGCQTAAAVEIYGFLAYAVSQTPGHAVRHSLMVICQILASRNPRHQKSSKIYDAHHSIIDDNEVIVDYNRQQLMPGWIPRRLGGGLGGKKESGQLRFGGRERPFRAPLRPIPYDDLKRLGIPLPPEGRFLSRFQVPSPPRSGRHSKKKDSPLTFRDDDREDTPSRRNSRAATTREDSKLRYRRSDDDISTESREGTHSRHRISKERVETARKQKSRHAPRDESSSRHRSPVDDDSVTRRRKRSPSGSAESTHKLHGEDRSHRHRKRSTS